MEPYKKVLTIAGSDSGAGAGIQADIKTIASLGLYATSAVTSITAQNTVGVQDVEEVSANIVSEQIKSILSDIGADAIKIGMLHNSKIVQSVAATLRDYSSIPIVLDPVMVATSGDNLLPKSAINHFKKNLFKLATVLTPNIKEAQILSNISIVSVEDMKLACKIIAKSGVENVLIKGGDLRSNLAIDVLYQSADDNYETFMTEMVASKNTHGTGCSYSSAIASFLALGGNLKTSIEKAKKFIYEAIKSGAAYTIGKGQGPIDHFWNTKGLSL